MRRFRVGIDATALHSHPVGASNYILQLTRALARRKEAVGSHPGIDQSDWLELFIFVQKSRQAMIDIKETPDSHLVIIPDMAPSVRLVWEQVSLPRMAKSKKIDLLHSLHYTMPLAYHGRSVVTLHDMTFFLFPQLHTLPKRYFFRFFIRTSSRQAAALVADSESTRQDAMRLVGIPAEKIFTAQLGVTQDFHCIKDEAALKQARQKYHLPEQFLLFVGMLEPRKNLPALLEAFSSIADQIPEHHLVVAGPKGWMVEDILQQRGTPKTTGKVHFPGYIEQADLPLVYNMADVFIYPSIYEGFGLPVLEAMACGTPVITSNVSSMPEIVGEAGVLLPPGDTRALAQATLELVNDPAKRQRLSVKGLERAMAFTWERTAEKTMAVYRYALGIG